MGGYAHVGAGAAGGLRHQIPWLLQSPAQVLGLQHACTQSQPMSSLSSPKF